MKFAFMSFSCPEATLKEMLDMARKFGYNGIEPRAQCQHKHGVELDASPEQRRAIKKMFSDSGIECACIATSAVYNFSDAAKRKEHVELTKQFIKLAPEVGCHRLRVFGGPADVKDRTKGEAVKIVGDALAEVKETAEQYRVYVCMETHDFFCRAEMTAAAVRRAASPFIRVNWDIMHPFTYMMSVEEAFLEIKDLIAHCHIHDGTYDKTHQPTLALMGEGEIPYNIAVRLLRDMNYDGYLSGEYINAWPVDVVLPHDLKVLKSYL